MTDPLPSVLLLSADTVGERMAGAGIRYWNLARVLGRQQPVTLAAPHASSIEPPPGVTLVAYGGTEVGLDVRGRIQADLLAAHDVIVCQQIPYYHADPDILANRYLVVDLYAPVVLENLEYARVDPERGQQVRRDDVDILNRLLRLGDFFICASERQRDFYLGALAVAGRLEPTYLTHDPEMRTLTDVVPFGLPRERPVKTGPGPRGTIAGIGPDDRVLLWNGGLWNWLDPLTAIRAVARLGEHRPPVRLVFMGTKSPVIGAAEMKVAEEARALARELDLLDTHVFFNDWVPYEERQNWLLEADAAVSLHAASVEARFAFRTRLLDNLWCGVPTLATQGDVLADIVAAEGIGLTVPPGDPEAVAEAMRQLLAPDRYGAMCERIAEVAAGYTWERACGPLLAFCRSPRRLGDTHGHDPTQDYVHRLERIYEETADYARHLERAIAERDARLTALGARFSLRASAARLRSLVREQFRRSNGAAREPAEKATAPNAEPGARLADGRDSPGTDG